MNCPTCQAKIKNTRYKVREPYVPKRPCSSKIFKHTKKKPRKKYKTSNVFKNRKTKTKMYGKKTRKTYKKKSSHP